MAPRRDTWFARCSTHPSELQEFLRAINEPWREDATNLDRTIPRNLVRHEVMPQLRAINAQADAALARAAEMLRGDEEFLERLANAAFLRCVQTDQTSRDGHAGCRRVFETLAAGAARRRGMRSKPPTRRERMA